MVVWQLPETKTRQTLDELLRLNIISRLSGQDVADDDAGVLSLLSDGQAGPPSEQWRVHDNADSIVSVVQSIPLLDMKMP
jgi:hypothetical protein